jgi:hypothetical protein
MIHIVGPKAFRQMDETTAYLYKAISSKNPRVVEIPSRYDPENSDDRRRGMRL